MHRLLGSDTLYRASTSISISNNVAPEDQVVNLDASIIQGRKAAMAVSISWVLPYLTDMLSTSRVLTVMNMH